MKLLKTILLVSALLAVSGCMFLGGQTPALTQKPGTKQTPDVIKTPAAANTKKYQFIFKAATNPIKLTTETDASHSTEASIGPAGGKLSVKAADGTQFTLEIPKKALAGVVKITMTPLSKLTGMPFDSKPSYALKLEPEGLYLYQDAILSILPSKPIPLAQQLFFSYQAAGEAVHLALPVVDTKEIKLRLTHFSGYGVAEGSDADVAAIENQLGGDAQTAIQSLVGEVLAKMREHEQDGTPQDPQLVQDMQDLMDQWEKEVIQPKIDAAGNSCAAAKEAVRSIIDMERTRQLLGVGTPANILKVMELANNGAVVCIKEEYQRCVQEHVITGMLPWYIDQLRQSNMANSGGQTGAAEPEGLILARDLTVKCLTFELQFHSMGSFKDGDAGYDSTVDGKILLHFDPDTFTIKGSGPIDNLAFDFRLPKGGKGMKCKAATQTGGSTFEVKALEYVTEQRDQVDPNEPQQFYFKDINLLYFPGVTSESYKIHCILTDSQGHQDVQDYSAPPGGYWSGIFFITHEDELNAGSAGPLKAGPPPMPNLDGIRVGALPAMPAPEVPADGGFFLNEFDITAGDAQLASKEWIKNNPSINVTEAGTIKIVHKPGD